jgi:hypothetical protein
MCVYCENDIGNPKPPVGTPNAKYGAKVLMIGMDIGFLELGFRFI